MAPRQTTRARKVVGEGRRALVDAARSLFTTRPYDQVTTAQIAEKADVAYGLITHHFVNKRGLYQAVLDEIAAEIAQHQLAPAPQGASLVDRLRHSMRSHITHVDGYADSFVAFVRGNIGVDPDQQSALDTLRWQGAQWLLLMVGITEPLPPALRAGMHGWVGHLDELMIDRITHGDLDIDTIVELATAALVTTLRTAARLDPSITFAPEVLRELDAFDVATRPR
ncbi:TetR/AcrR family transcriptional regulator [Pseudonocardia spinosispora]|uniref:TetR/AcrR family transcriptional regulator n=1 Tax=Pseudonocardia spinosispora TaxID=103441 RepID=UPI00048C5D7A|nr:TetR/AcrR family transcriptional regulator [Pseudonocardia spinosispora]